ncbi:DUF3243 domain-containing protein [Desulfoscipio sp. XC116]|uniref:DUF3243 domain-containing protein n=1 Tax=Desulfoscipio sp. XC116 TaxID=3144975 RepID=UPI00325A96D4
MELEVSWHQCKKILHQVVNAAEAVGVSDEHINDVACRLGDFLANRVDPGNREQRLLNELWDEAREEEKKVLTRLIVRMVNKTENM